MAMLSSCPLMDYALDIRTHESPALVDPDNIHTLCTLICSSASKAGSVHPGDMLTSRPQGRSFGEGHVGRA